MNTVTKTALTDFKIALRDGNRTLRDVAAEIAGPPAPVKQKANEVTFPEVPTPKVITEADRAALAKFPTVFAKVVPAERRVLSTDEIAALHEEREVLQTVTTLMTGRVDDIGEYIRTHVDEDALKTGKGDVKSTLRDAKGHFILASKSNPTRIPIPGTNEDFSLEFRAGRKGEAYLDGEHLLDLLESGKITRAQYLSITRERRVFDEAKAQDACVKDPTLLPIIASLIRYSANGAPGTSLFVRKTK